MQKKIIKLIIFMLFFGWIVYQFGIPEYKTFNSFKDSEQLYKSILKDSVNWQTIDYSTNGNRIYLLEVGESENTTFILGGIHGDEHGSFNLTLRLARYINANRHLISKKLIIVPTINPDGLMANTRKNINKVDINRNFPSRDWTPVYSKDNYYPGSEPASEVETNTILKIINKYKPEKIISIHTNQHLIEHVGPAKNLAYEISRYNGYKVLDNVGYDTPGSLDSYTGRDLGIPTITLELPPYDPDQAWIDNKDALISAINF